MSSPARVRELLEALADVDPDALLEVYEEGASLGYPGVPNGPILSVSIETWPNRAVLVVDGRANDGGDWRGGCCCGECE